MARRYNSAVQKTTPTLKAGYTLRVARRTAFAVAPLIGVFFFIGVDKPTSQNAVVGRNVITWALL